MEKQELQELAVRLHRQVAEGQHYEVAAQVRDLPMSVRTQLLELFDTPEWQALKAEK